MPPSPQVTVGVNLSRVRENAIDVRRRVGVPVLAVIKADAYGLGASRVVESIDDVVDGYCVFSFREALAAGLRDRTSKPVLQLGPDGPSDAAAYVEQHVRPAVWEATRATALRAARPVLSVDTGMQRFACPENQVQAVRRAGECDEAFTHATRLEHVTQLLRVVGGRTAGLRLHAAGTAMMEEPAARLDAVRPGLALYSGAVRVSTRLVEARDTNGPAGYGGFAARRHGVILAGYSNGLRPGPCRINGELRRVIEVGMQSAFVELGPNDRAGDEVTFLETADDLEALRQACNTTPHEVLFRMCGAGVREYENP